MSTCIICSSKMKYVFSKQFNISCGDYFEGKRLFSENLENIDLYQCENCGFSSFNEMHSWNKLLFSERIYNEEYILADKPFEYERPTQVAEQIAFNFDPCNVIDFGGGRGVFADKLNNFGFNAVTYDPFYLQSNSLPSWKADIVTAFEVIEHVANQIDLFTTLKCLCKPQGIIIFSTLLSDETDLTKDWYYASPRNGHISFHNKKSLLLLCNSVGLDLVSSNSGVHIAIQKLPNFHIIDKPFFSLQNNSFIKS